MSSNQTAVEASPYRLPTTATPSFYDIRITPDIAGGKHFNGEQKVLLEVSEPTSEIVLNAAEMEITEAVLVNDDGTRMVGKATVDNATERATIRFDGIVGTGHWELDLKFVGTFNPKLKGFYLSRYKNADGGDEVMATTKFEPCDARRAFPCWDEPAIKARFKISLVIDENLKAVSNARLLKETPIGGGKKLLEFAPSIKMSTYVVAYVIGKLEASDAVIADGIPIRVWSVAGKKHMHGFGLSAAKFSLEYFARYFGVPYPGDKLDLIAIPDFASGAMENFACITFRETALLVDTKTASLAELKRVAEVVMHENAHMWFGDFTTMSWWNGLWLNEAFATFMAAKSMHAWKPEWKFWDGFNIDRAGAMRVDGLCETRSIEFPVRNPDEARGMFDVLTYEKGCAILRMLELFLGEEEFRRGIANYLEKHSFANADTPDLWAAIEQEIKSFSDSITATDLMNTWVFQPGFPVVTVEESEVTGSITLKQQIFRYVGGELPNSVWHVPVHLRATVTGDNGAPETIEKVLLLSKKAETFYLGENLSSVIVNAGGHGFYRVTYQPQLRQKALDNFGSLSAGERFNFVNDLWASVQSGQTSVREYLGTVGIICCMHAEMDVNVFSVIVSSLQTLRRMVPRNADNARGLLRLATDYAGSAMNKLGVEPKAGEDSQDAELRGMLMTLLGVLGDAKVRSWATAAYDKYVVDKTAVSGNLVGAMIATLAAHGDSNLYDEFIARKNSASTPQEETRLLYALADFRDSALATRTLNGCVDGTVRTQDAPFVIQRVLMNAAVQRVAWDFVKANWDKMVGLYPVQGITRLCEAVSVLVDDDIADEVPAFFATHMVKAGEKSIKQYLEQQRIARQLKQRDGSSLQELLLV